MTSKAVRSGALRRAVALVLAGVCLVAGCGDTSSSDRERSPVRGAATLAERFGGTPQDGPILGAADAPYTLVEFADLQCPFCAQFDREILPEVIERFVRPGRLRIELRPVAFLGRDSGPAAAATVAAGQQDRMWQFADLFYRNQGRENSGYVTAQFLGRIAAAVPGLDRERFERTSGSSELAAILEANARAARTARITGTPGLRLGRTGGVLEPFDQGRLDRDDILERLADAIGGERRP